MIDIGRSIRAALPILAGLLTTTPLQAQAVRGRVLELGADRPVAFGVVRLLGTDGIAVDSTLADSAGNFTMVAPEPGRYSVAADRFGYEARTSPPVGVQRDQGRFVELRLPPAVFILDPVGVYVEAKSRRLADVGFYERRRLSPGYFIDPEMIERRSPRDVSDLFTNVPGTRLVPAGGGKNRVVLRGGVRTACPPQIYVDEVPIMRTGAREIFFLDDIVAANHVEGIEVYRSHAELPSRFSTDLGRCGAIVVWTKAGSRH